METSSTVANWLSLAATVIGLGSLVTQFRAIIEHTGPFHALRDIQHLGRWWFRQPHLPWYRVFKPPPVGPIISANLSHGICGRKTVDVSRLPLSQPAGQAAWSILLGVIHPVPSAVMDPRANSSSTTLCDENIAKTEHIVTTSNEPSGDVPSEEWSDLVLRPLIKHKSTTSTMISRTTLMTLFTVTNARQIFRHSGSSGHRAAYASYAGQWYVEWPIGDAARVRFAAHDSHTLSRDVYPRTFESRVDKCLQMLAGVIDAPAPSSFKCAFPGRTSTGKWILRHAVRGFGLAHGGRHLYHMIGGNVGEVDFLSMKMLNEGPTVPEHMVILALPSTDGGDRDVTLYVPKRESDVLNKALDYLPWSCIPWSIHRGLRDILVAFAKERMDQHRHLLAETLRSAVSQWPERLDARGWRPQFVRESMADIAANAVLAGRGNSGDAVRVVTDIAVTLWDGTASGLDETVFWRCAATHPMSSSSPSLLNPMAVAALVKCFVLEWSNELDYQMYHDLPLELCLG